MAIAKERLWFNEDKTKLVKDGDPAARFLAAAEGDEIPEVEKPAKADKAEGVVVEKAAEKASNKAAKADEDK